VIDTAGNGGAAAAAATGRPSRGDRIGWYFYDFANSAFVTSVTTVFLGPYLTSVARAAADADGLVHPMGVAVPVGAYFPYLVSLSLLLQMVLLPFLGAVADYSARKKPMLLFFAYLGALSTAALYGVRGESYGLGGLLYLVASISFGASIVLYNAFLPELAAADERDAVSSRGWALGYLGGGLLLALNLVLVSRAPALGLTTEEAVRLSLLSAGAWWGLFTLVPLATLRRRQPVRRMPPGERYVVVGLTGVGRMLAGLRTRPHMLRFLVAHLLYSDGIQTVVVLTTQFGQEELGLPMSTLMQVILMVQFVALFGALAFGRVARAVGGKRAIMLSLLVWIGAVLYAYGRLRTAAEFVALAAVVALVLGGSQALSRSVYSVMVPRGLEAGHFSLYELSGRGASWLGPLLFGVAVQFTGSYRIALLSTLVFFVAGLALLAQVDVRRAAAEVGDGPPAAIADP
jgi:UMF1 family MFS transporter